MTTDWKNWSGSVRFTPGTIEKPRHDRALAELVRRAAEKNQIVRVVGAGHSSMPLMETPDALISMEHFTEVESTDAERGEAVVGAGMKVEEASKHLLEKGLALHNTGDIDQQTIGGAIATATHGTGRKLQNLAGMLIGARLINGLGEVVEYHIEDHPDIIRGLRSSLGAIGLLTALRIKVQPKFQLHRRELCTNIDPVLEHLDQLMAENRNFDFYWYPRSDEAKIRLLNEPGSGTADLPYAHVTREYTGWSGDVLPRHRELRFEEMEYMLPIEAGPACFQEVRARIKDRWRQIVGWRVLYRTIAADDAYLSTAHARDSVSISLHQNASLPYWDFFKDIEPIFRAHNGRPHWAKKHTLGAAALAPLYPCWDDFNALRHQFDPENRFLNLHLRQLLEPEGVTA